MGKNLYIKDVDWSTVSVKTTEKLIKTGTWFFNLEECMLTSSLGMNGNSKYVDGFAARDLLVGKTITKIKIRSLIDDAYGDLVYYNNCPDINSFDNDNLVTVQHLQFETPGIHIVNLQSPITMTSDMSMLGISNYKPLVDPFTILSFDNLVGIEHNWPNNCGIVFDLDNLPSTPYEFSIQSSLGIDYYVLDD